MSRREEVKNKLISCRNVIDRGTLARTLADEVDAITAERDEWKRRLDAVVVQFGEIVCDPSCGITWTCSRCQAHAAAIAIAEGRDNG